MQHLRISQAALLMGVSDDTVRRWLDDDRVHSVADANGRRLVDGASLARFAQSRAGSQPDVFGGGSHASARNRFTGLVTNVVSDTVMSQVDLQCGPYRVVSLISAEAVREMDLKPGMVATAMVKATNVVVETPAEVTS